MSTQQETNVLAELATTTVNTATYDTAMLILRVAFGVTMFAHGYQKMFKGGKIDGTAGWFDSIGMKPGKVHAMLASTVEMGSGILLTVGFLTSFACAAFVALMLVAGYTVHGNSGFYIVSGGWEYNMILAVSAIGIAMLGPAAYSIDRGISIDNTLDGWVGLAIAVVVGIGTGVGQLALFFRPPPAEDT